MSCRGLCDSLRVRKGIRRRPYSSGLRYCRHCECFIRTDALSCPCCKKRIRTKPKCKLKATEKKEPIFIAYYGQA